MNNENSKKNIISYKKEDNKDNINNFSLQNLNNQNENNIDLEIIKGRPDNDYITNKSNNPNVNYKINSSIYNFAM